MAMLVFLSGHPCMAEVGALHNIQLMPEHDALSGEFQVGEVSQKWSQIIVELEGGKKHVLRVRAESDRFSVGFEGGKKHEMPDAVINLNGVRCFIRPRLVRYEVRERSACHRGKLQKDLIAKWESLPAASKSFVKFEVLQNERGFQWFLNDQYAGRRESVERLKALSFVLSESGGARNLKSLRHFSHPDFYPLNISSRAAGVRFRAEASPIERGTISLKPGLQEISGIPMFVTNAAESADIGVVRQMKGSWALECDEYLSRTALDGMLESVHFAVPQGHYVRAYALCAVETDSAKVPIITARMTRFARSGRSEAISDTTLALPRDGESFPQGVRQVGTVKYEADGKTIEAPLLLVEFKLKPGDILDLLSAENDPHASMMRQPYLDFEFVGKLGGVSAQWDSRRKPDNHSTSAVHVFGAALERSPVEFHLTGHQPGNIFHNDEKPELTVTLKARRPCKVSLDWEILDVNRNVVTRKNKLVSLSSSDDRDIPISLQMKQLGWYGIEFTMTDGRRRELLRHTASFALLGKDTREAGYESPYGTWWFAHAHYGAADKEVAGPMMFKAGLRKTTFGWSKYSEKDMARWKITMNQIRWFFRLADLENMERACERVGTKVDELLKRFPHCRQALIFHESFAHYVPAELRNARQKEDVAATERSRKSVKLATLAAEFYRRKYPKLKLVVGNTSSSASIIAALLRHGFAPKYIDFIGVEAVGQTCVPEKLWEGSTQGIWLAREAARKFGHDLPVTGCYEFTARTDRNLGPRRQAEWIVRDMLLCHAYKFKNINPAIIHDAGNSYFNTLWGAGGLCRRHPLLYPKPAYVAVATLTKALDRVTLLRQVPTGSSTVYALELRRADGNFVYALWTVRGEAGLRLQFEERAEVDLIGCYGRQRQTSTSLLRKRLALDASTAPNYIVSPKQLRSVEIISRSFKAAPRSFRLASRMDNVEEWRLQEADMSLSNPNARGLPIRVVGDISLTQIKDKEKGQCLQLRLNRNRPLPDIVSEYAVMKLRRPEPIPGKPARIGLRVKGDSGWGKIVFEIQDATGALWRTEGAYHDWPGELSIAHDGWRYVDFPIDGSSVERNISAGRRWNTNSPRKDARIEFPIKIAGLYVVMNRKALDLAEMKEVKGVLRFRDIGTSEETE